MTNYIELATSLVKSESQIRNEHPQTSYPALFRADGYALVFPAPQPTYDPITQSVREIAPVLNALGQYAQAWEIVELYQLPADKSAAIAAHLAALKAAFIKQVDADADAVIKAVMGERATEYLLAEQEATAFKVAGYTGAVPGSVSSEATAKGITATVACDIILATAAGWRTAQAALRAQRLLAKAAASSANTAADLDIVKAQWTAFLSTLKGQLGL